MAEKEGTSPEREMLDLVNEMLPRLRAIRERLPPRSIKFGIAATACDRLAVLQSHLYQALEGAPAPGSGSVSDDRRPVRGTSWCPYRNCNFSGTDEEVDDHRASGAHDDEPQAGSNKRSAR